MTLETAPGPEASGCLGTADAEADVNAPGLLEEEVFDAVACNFGLSGLGHLCDALANMARLLWANRRPGTAGTPVYLVVRALRPPSPSVELP